MLLSCKSIVFDFNKGFKLSDLLAMFVSKYYAIHVHSSVPGCFASV